jgi:hypothetical protein
MDSTIILDFKKFPIEIALHSLPHMSKHLQLQYDGKPPPFLLALAARQNQNLEILYADAQKIYKDINLRVDHSNQNAVKDLPLEKFRHVMFISDSRHR